MEKFDPSKAELGVHNRLNYNPAHKPRKMDFSASVDVPVEDIGADFEESREEALKVGAYSSATADILPDDTAYPTFPEPGEHDTSRKVPEKTDLGVHGAHEAPKPNPKQLIKARLQNLRKQVKGGQKEIVQDVAEAQQRQHESFKHYPTDLSVNRRELDKSRSDSNLKKIASIGDILEEDTANPIKILLVLDQLYEEEWRDWEPETITQTLKADDIDVSRLNMDKIMALKVVHNTMNFWEDPRTFEKVVLSFAGRMVDWGHIQEARVHEMAACVALIERYIAEHEFSDDVAALVAASALRDGFVMLPPPLSFAQFQFANELAMTMGDDALGLQQKLMDALEDEEPEIPKDHGVQYMRLLRCQYHVQDVIDGAKA